MTALIAIALAAQFHVGASVVPPPASFSVQRTAQNNGARLEVRGETYRIVGAVVVEASPGVKVRFGAAGVLQTTGSGTSASRFSPTETRQAEMMPLRIAQRTRSTTEWKSSFAITFAR